MDTRTGQIYTSKDEATADLLSRGVPPDQIEGRLVFGSMKDLRKMRKRIRKQLRRQTELLQRVKQRIAELDQKEVRA